MAPAADPAFRQAMDRLMLHVDRDNVLAVHRAFQDHADNLRLYLREVGMYTEVGRCGGDPVSRDAARSFAAKIGQLLGVHWAHWRELDAVARELRDAAQSYGHTEQEITRSLTTETTR